MTITYGAHRHGLLCGYVFTSEGSRPLDLAQAIEWLKAPPTRGSDFVWLHFDLSDASAEAWMQSHLPLPADFFDALRQGTRSTRIEDVQDQLLAIINDVAYEFAFDPSEIATLWMCASRSIAVTARSHPLRSIDRVREAVKRGRSFRSSVELLRHLMDNQGDVMARIVREATVQVDSIEDRLLRGRLRHERAELSKLRSVLVRLQRLLAPEPAAMFRLLRTPPPWMAAQDLDDLRQSTEEFSLVLRDIAALQERIKLLQEEIAAQVGEQTNRSLFTLTMVTVLALPINITSGFFGMNVSGIPFADARHGFLAVVIVAAAFTGVAAWWAFRRRE
jgi:zinc transporter